MHSENECNQIHSKTITFMPGPVGLQLEPISDSAHKCLAKVVRFVDGGPRNPGQARKCGEIRPGDFVIRAEAANEIGTTYDGIIRVLKISHAVRELTFLPAWGTRSPSKQLIPEFGRDAPSILIHQITRSPSCDDDSSNSEPACTNDYSRLQAHHSGPIIVPLDGSRISEEQQPYAATQSHEANNVGKLPTYPNNDCLVDNTTDYFPTTKVICDQQETMTPSKPPRSRFAVDTPLYLAKTSNNQDLVVPAKGQIFGPSVNIDRENQPDAELREPSKSWKLSSILLLNRWNIQSKTLTNVVDAARGSLVPAFANSSVLSTRIATKIAPAISLHPNTVEIFSHSNTVGKSNITLTDSSGHDHQTPMKLGTDLSLAEISLDPREKSNEEWQESVDELCREKMALHQHFEEKLRLARVEHVSSAAKSASQMPLNILNSFLVCWS